MESLYVLIPKEDRANKLSVKAEEAIFIGYEKGTKGYKFWSPKWWRVIISSTATFDEFTFPFCTKKTDDKPPSLSIPDDSNDVQESDKSDKPKSSEDILTTYYVLPISTIGRWTPQSTDPSRARSWWSTAISAHYSWFQHWISTISSFTINSYYFSWCGRT